MKEERNEVRKKRIKKSEYIQTNKEKCGSKRRKQRSVVLFKCRLAFHCISKI
jgi:hypothetical protein